MIEHWDYLIAWMVYLLAGAGCCLVWWRLTRGLTSKSLRDLLRGVAVVLIFTPWFAGDSDEFLAPAIVVLLFDLLLAGVKNGLQGGLILLSMLFVMVLFLTVKLLLRKRPVD
ncbi:MAG: hypothetical protein QGI68_03360 [Pseudomonadales bacterium]|nr:hypothetical protein [Pseudomonadales bacterium]MDP7145165.1 hypothetical protein [Pseudomonadales bacterium]MDP7358781.1 hypothetical protein [Pseudomonadales bacterium]MDP7594593.1 hypothetical protein [Pseudomonadales bacterium]HJN52477.1 hypothetical protein [Pseudomonadales bacterium]